MYRKSKPKSTKENRFLILNQVPWKILRNNRYSDFYHWRLLLFSRSVMSNSLRPPWTTACQASLSFTISQSLLKLMSTESVMPSNRLIFCHPLLLLPSIFPSTRVFSNESALCISVGASASESVLPMNIQGWFPLGMKISPAFFWISYLWNHRVCTLLCLSSFLDTIPQRQYF